jgi:hypothetical protein
MISRQMMAGMLLGEAIAVWEVRAGTKKKKAG